LPNNQTTQASLDGKSIKSNNTKVQTVKVLDLNVPASFNMQLLQNNYSSDWLSIKNSMYEGEMMLSTGENGYISSIKVRGEIANHIEKTYLISKFGNDINFPWDDPKPQLQPIECFMDCMRGQPLNGWIVAGCLTICGWKSI